MITLLTQEAGEKHPKFTAILYLSIYTFAFPSSSQTILCEVQPPTHAVLMQTLLDVTLMCIQKAQIQDF